MFEDVRITTLPKSKLSLTEGKGERDHLNFRLHLASGVLVPLFGLHNILAAFKPDAEESKIRIAIEVYSALSIAFQV